MNFLLKQNFKSFFSSKNKIYQSNDSFLESGNLTETILPLEYLISSLNTLEDKEETYLIDDGGLDNLVGGQRLYRLNRDPNAKKLSLEDMFRNLNVSDLRTLEHILNHLAKGKTSITEDLDGKLEFLKFSNFKNLDENLKLNVLNLKQIPIYTIVNKKGNILGFKNSKHLNLNKNVFGFFDYEDAVNCFYELKPKLGSASSNYGISKSKYPDYRIEKFNFETFYKMWILGQRNVTLVPSAQNLGNTVYITKSPYSQIGGKEIYLTSFSKPRLTEILKKAGLKNKKIIHLETDEFFNQTLNHDLPFAYFFISHEIPDDKALVSGKNLTSAQADFDLDHGLTTDEPDIKIGMFAPLRTLKRKFDIASEKRYQKYRFSRPYWYRMFRWDRKTPKKVMRFGRLGSKYQNHRELAETRLNSRPFYTRAIHNKTFKSCQQSWLAREELVPPQVEWWERKKIPKGYFSVTSRWEMLSAVKTKISKTQQQLFASSRHKKRQISSLKFWRYRKFLLAPKQMTSQSFTKQKPKNFAINVENQLTDKIAYLTLEDFLTAKYKAENLLPKNKS